MKTPLTRPLFCLIALLPAAVGLTACKSRISAATYKLSSADAGQKQTKKAQELNAQAEQARTQKLPHADPNVPDSQYAPLASGYQLAALFYALSGMPPDYDVLAASASEEYRGTTDQFRKRDLLQALRAKTDQDLTRYKDPQNRYFIMQQASVPLQHYDFKTSAFPIAFGIGAGTSSYFPDSPQYKLAYNNGNQFLRLPVADQQRAREIESMVTNNGLWGGESTFYLFVQDANIANNQLNGQIVRVVLKDRQHGEIARF